MGPILLYISEITKKDETYYSFIFMAKAVGFIGGGQLLKFLEKRYHHHTLFKVLLLLAGFFLILSSMNFSFLNLFTTIMLASGCFCMMIALSLYCITKIFPKDEQEYYILLNNISFGIGGLVGPIIVIIFEATAMRAIGVAVLLASVLFFLFASNDLQTSSDGKKE